MTAVSLFWNNNRTFFIHGRQGILKSTRRYGSVHFGVVVVEYMVNAKE